MRWCFYPVSWRILAGLFIQNCLSFLHAAGTAEMDPITEWVQAVLGNHHFQNQQFARHLKNNNQICPVISAISRVAPLVWIRDTIVSLKDSKTRWASEGDQQGHYSKIKGSVTENSAVRSRVQEIGHY